MAPPRSSRTGYSGHNPSSDRSGSASDPRYHPAQGYDSKGIAKRIKDLSVDLQIADKDARKPYHQVESDIRFDTMRRLLSVIKAYKPLRDSLMQMSARRGQDTTYLEIVEQQCVTAHNLLARLCHQFADWAESLFEAQGGMLLSSSHENVQENVQENIQEFQERVPKLVDVLRRIDPIRQIMHKGELQGKITERGIRNRYVDEDVPKLTFNLKEIEGVIALGIGRIADWVRNEILDIVGDAVESGHHRHLLRKMEEISQYRRITDLESSLKYVWSSDCHQVSQGKLQALKDHITSGSTAAQMMSVQVGHAEGTQRSGDSDLRRPNPRTEPRVLRVPTPVQTPRSMHQPRPEAPNSRSLPSTNGLLPRRPGRQTLQAGLAETTAAQGEQIERVSTRPHLSRQTPAPRNREASRSRSAERPSRQDSHRHEHSVAQVDAFEVRPGNTREVRARGYQLSRESTSPNLGAQTPAPLYREASLSGSAERPSRQFYRQLGAPRAGHRGSRLASVPVPQIPRVSTPQNQGPQAPQSSSADRHTSQESRRPTYPSDRPRTRVERSSAHSPNRQPPTPSTRREDGTSQRPANQAGSPARVHGNRGKHRRRQWERSLT